LNDFVVLLSSFMLYGTIVTTNTTAMFFEDEELTVLIGSWLS